MYTIKDWNEHQPPLKDRNVIWIKVYRRLLEDYDFISLSDSNQATLIKLWLLASENHGKLPNIEEIAFRLRKEKDFIIKQLLELSVFVLNDDDSTITPCEQLDNNLVTSGKQNVSLEKSRDREEKIRVDDEFHIFWGAYPRKIGKHKAQESWSKSKPPLDMCLQTLVWQSKSKEWFQDSGKFIPHPTTWINAKRWLDEKSEEITF